MLTFDITRVDQANINVWLEGLKPKIIEKQKILKEVFGLEEYNLLTNNGTEPYYGTIGGGLKYIFTPTALGIIKSVKETITSEELNLTDFDSF